MKKFLHRRVLVGIVCGCLFMFLIINIISHQARLVSRRIEEDSRTDDRPDFKNDESDTKIPSEASASDTKLAGQLLQGSSDEQMCSAQRPDLGKISIFVAFVTKSYENNYKVAQQTLRCYVERTGYELMLVDIYTDPEVTKKCSHTDLFYRKHCAASIYLAKTDWMLVLDADTGIVNPNHCIHEYIDTNFDVILYERFFNWEVASGNYLVRNTAFARKWLLAWSDYQYTQPSGFTGADNGALQIHLLKTILPHGFNEHETCRTIWAKATTYETYMEYVTCCKVFRGAQFEWKDARVKLFRRGHGWVMDWFMSNDKWCPVNFMFHGWKANTIGDKGWDSPFTVGHHSFHSHVQPPNGTDCEPGSVWPYRPERRVPCKVIKTDLFKTEEGSAKSYPAVAREPPYLKYADVGQCWPNCHKENITV